MTVDLAQAQAAQDVWSRRNFPDRNPDHAIFGLIEELGELCEALALSEDAPPAYHLIRDLQVQVGRLAHINLKRAQGIRKASTSDEREFDTIDQLGRAAMEYYCHAGYPPNPEVEAEVFVPDEAKERDAVGDLMIYLIDRCNRRGWDLAAILDETLAQVLQRDWVTDPAAGVGVA